MGNWTLSSQYPTYNNVMHTRFRGQSTRGLVPRGDLPPLSDHARPLLGHNNGLHRPPLFSLLICLSLFAPVSTRERGGGISLLLRDWVDDQRGLGGRGVDSSLSRKRKNGWRSILEASGIPFIPYDDSLPRTALTTHICRRGEFLKPVLSNPIAFLRAQSPNCLPVMTNKLFLSLQQASSCETGNTWILSQAVYAGTRYLRCLCSCSAL